MRFPLPHFLAAATLFCLAGSDALAQVERGGGLFSRNRNSSQISAGLFPDDPSSPAAAPAASQRRGANASPNPRRGGLSIFRSGSPEPVEPTAYVIAEGAQIPVAGTPEPSGSAPEAAAAPAESSAAPGVELAADTPREAAGLGGLFSFGRRANQEQSRESEPIVETVAAPVVASPAPATPAPRVASASAPTEDEDMLVAQPTPAQGQEARERRAPRLALPFFNRRDRSDQEEVPTFAEPDSSPLVAEAVPEQRTPAAASSSSSAPAASSSTSPSRSAPASSASSSGATVAASAPSAAPAESTSAAPASESNETTTTGSDGRPEYVVTAPSGSGELPSSERSGGGITIPSLPNPISVIRTRASRPVDMSNAETIIEGGEIVAESRTAHETTVVTVPATGSREAPRTVDGVTTYSSWSDVGGRPVSAADRIISQMR